MSSWNAPRPAFGQPAQGQPAAPAAQPPAPFTPQQAPAAAPAAFGQRGGQTQANTSRLFAGMKGARGSMDANYIRPGHYVGKIEKVTCFASRKNQEFFCIEYTILAVVDPLSHFHAKDVVPGYKGSVPHYVGEKCSHLIKAGDTFLGNVKAFLTIATGLPEDQIDENVAMIASNEDPSAGLVQPLAGTIVEFEAKVISTRTNNPFTKVVYRRQISPMDAKANLDPATIDRLFPNGQLDRLIAMATGQTTQG